MASISWDPWQAVTTTGGASIVAAGFTSSPSEGDTYGIGETIRAEVTWSQNVTVSNGGDDANVFLRLDVGADDNDQSNSRRKMGYVSGSGTDTLTFEYVVQATDLDADGVWLQTVSDAVVFLESGATHHGRQPQHQQCQADQNRPAHQRRRQPQGGREHHGHGGCGGGPGGDAGSDGDAGRQRVVILAAQSVHASYQWTQTSGDTVTLSDATAQNPTFTAPSLTANPDLEFSLVVNDGTNPSAPDAVKVAVLPPLNPTSAPCAHPAAAGEMFVPGDVVEVTATSDTSISYRGFASGAVTNDLYFCWPNGTRELRAENVVDTHTETVSELSNGTTYWVTGNSSDGSLTVWNQWKAVTTTGGASILAAGFTSIPALGDTYLIGETIQAQVTWSQNVTVSNGGDDANVSLRLDLGADDNDQTNSRRKMAYVSGSGTDTLTFEYTVQPADMDSDGVWLQTDSDAVVFLESGATITGGNPSTNNVKLTRTGLPTSGDASRKVDGTTTATADAGDDQEVETGAAVTLMGSGRSALIAGQDVIWYAPLTVKNVGTSGTVFGCSNNFAGVRCSNTSVLTEDSFTFDSVDYQVDIVVLTEISVDGVRTPALAIEFNKAIPQELVDGARLLVDGTSFDLSDGNLGDDEDQVIWHNPGFTWVAEQVVELRLSRPNPSSPGPTFTYAWTQTGRTSVSLSSATAQSPTFTAPSFKDDLEFSLVVNDGVNDSAPDTVKVAVRPPLNPASAPCQHPAPAGTSFTTLGLTTHGGVTDTSLRFVGGAASGTVDLYFCWPDSTREKLATGVAPGTLGTKTGLSSGTTYWAAAHATLGDSSEAWTGWEAFATSGGATLLAMLGSLRRRRRGAPTG